MAEYDKKRKAGITPPENTRNKFIRKSKRIAKKVEKEGKPFILEHSSSEDERNRTPSGILISTKVSDIRNYFDPSIHCKSVKGSKKMSVNSLQNKCETNQAEQHVSSGEVDHASLNTEENNLDHEQKGSATTDMSKQEEENASQPWSAYSSQDEGVNYESQEDDRTEDEKETAFLHTLAKLLDNKKNPSSSSESHNSTSNSIEDTEVRVENNMQSEQDVTMTDMENDDSPKSISIHSVMEMFRQLKRDREEDKKELRATLKEMKDTCIKKAEQKAKSTISKEVQKIKVVEAEMAYWKLRSETLMEVCQRLNNEVGDLTTRIENLEFNSTKKKLLMTGYLIDSNLRKWQNIRELGSFLSEALQIDVVIDEYFSLGNLDQRQTVLIFQTIEERRQVFRFKNNLKGILHQGQEVYISDYLPPAALDRKKRERDIQTMYEESPEALQYSKGSLCVNGRPYQKVIVPPSPKDLISMDAEELEKVLKINTKRSPKITADNSSFIAYAVPVNTYDEIESAYKKVKMIQPDAKHVVCAYQISDSSCELGAEPCYQMDYHDDGETSVGRLLLDLLIEHNLKQRAIFVARIYGGKKMGLNRLKCYLRAAKFALDLPVPEVNEQVSKPPPAFARNVSNKRGMGTKQGRRGKSFASTNIAAPSSNTTKFGRGFQRNAANSRSYSASVRGARPPSTQQRYNQQRPNGYDKYNTDPDFRPRMENYQYRFSDPWTVPAYSNSYYN